MKPIITEKFSSHFPSELFHCKLSNRLVGQMMHVQKPIHFFSIHHHHLVATCLKLQKFNIYCSQNSKCLQQILSKLHQPPVWAAHNFLITCEEGKVFYMQTISVSRQLKELFTSCFNRRNPQPHNQMGQEFVIMTLSAQRVVQISLLLLQWNRKTKTIKTNMLNFFS